MIIVSKTFKSKEFKKLNAEIKYGEIENWINRFFENKIIRKWETYLRWINVNNLKMAKLRVWKWSKFRLLVILLVNNNKYFPIIIRQKWKSDDNISVKFMEKLLVDRIDSTFEDYQKWKYEVLKDWELISCM